MILLSAGAAALLSVMLAIALLNLRTALRLSSGRGPGADGATVSLLIPARDEARNLIEHLPSLLAIDYEPLEIVVLDDGSSDGTGRVVGEAAARSGGRLRLLRGSAPPPGWLGKNWACHQLAESAGGEVLLFCDADVDVAPGAVHATVVTMLTTGAHMLTALPRQRLGSWLEAAVVPIVTQLPVMATLTLRLIPRTRSPGLSMANGQWLAITRSAYDRCGGHAGVRGEVLEDVALGRRAKASGVRLLVALAPDLLSVRMYRSAAELREGFAKNLYSLAGGRPMPFVVVAAVFSLVAIYPWIGVAVGAPGAGVALLLLLALRVCVAVPFRNGPATLLLHPLGSVVALGLACESFRRSRAGTLRWKGRSLPSAGRIQSAGRSATPQ